MYKHTYLTTPSRCEAWSFNPLNSEQGFFNYCGSQHETPSSPNKANPEHKATIDFQKANTYFSYNMHVENVHALMGAHSVGLTW